jgi:hypothetical protein
MLISGVGDLFLYLKCTGGISNELRAEVTTELVHSNLSIGNLENPLINGGNPTEGKCCLKADPSWAKVIKEKGINVVSLANNHLMDYGTEGLLSTISALDDAGVIYAGAGRDKEEACKSKYIDISGYRIGLLGRSSVIVSSPCYATEKQAGVAFHDIEETKRNIRECKRNADLVIVMIHWGLEEYSYPSPNQRTLAKEMIQAGADIVLGHHPHVLQGIEHIGKGVVVYSLGNFIFSEFEWVFKQSGKEDVKLFSCLSSENREGMILKIEWDKDKPISFSPVFTKINLDGALEIDNSKERFRQFEKISKRLDLPLYNLWWHFYSLKQEWKLRIGPRLNLKKRISKLHKVRPHHVKELITAFRRSAKVATGKSTNPYE